MLKMIKNIFKRKIKVLLLKNQKKDIQLISIQGFKFKVIKLMTLFYNVVQIRMLSKGNVNLQY